MHFDFLCKYSSKKCQYLQRMDYYLHKLKTCVILIVCLFWSKNTLFKKSNKTLNSKHLNTIVHNYVNRRQSNWEWNGPVLHATQRVSLLYPFQLTVFIWKHDEIGFQQPSCRCWEVVNLFIKNKKNQMTRSGNVIENRNESFTWCWVRFSGQFVKKILFC